MIKIGIDFSLNSPSLTIQYENGEYEFHSFFNDEGRNFIQSGLKKHQLHKKLHIEKLCNMHPYTREELSKDYVIEQRQKMRQADMIAHEIVSFLCLKFPMRSVENIRIAIEGFAFNSKGAASIDLIMYNSFLRRDLINEFPVECIVIVPPTQAKKLAGKGNADKNYMIKAFMDNKLDDANLAKTRLWNFIKDYPMDEKHIKPVDDIIDSYFILNCI